MAYDDVILKLAVERGENDLLNGSKSGLQGTLQWASTQGKDFYGDLTSELKKFLENQRSCQFSIIQLKDIVDQYR